MPGYLLVSNPTAQSGRNAERIERARRGLVRRGIRVEVLATLPAGRTIDHVREALDRQDYAMVVAMGGDGTFREVAAGLLDSRAREEICLGTIPTGTGNDQGRSFGIEAGEAALETNLDTLVEGAWTWLDAGRLGTFDEADAVLPSWFFDSAGWGLSARVLRQRNVDRTWIRENLPALGAVYRDQLVYAGALLKTLVQSRVADHLSARVVADGIVHELAGLTDLVVKNTRVYGGAWVLDPESRPDDGLFEVVPIRGRRDWLSRAIVDLEGSPFRKEAFKGLRAARIEVSFTSDGRLDAQVDGEEAIASRRTSIEVIPRALRLVVPAAYQGADQRVPNPGP